MSMLFCHQSHRWSPVPREGAVERQLIECRSEFLRYFRRSLACREDAEDALREFSLKVIRRAAAPRPAGAEAEAGGAVRGVLRRRLPKLRLCRHGRAPTGVRMPPPPRLMGRR